MCAAITEDTIAFGAPCVVAACHIATPAQRFSGRNAAAHTLISAPLPSDSDTVECCQGNPSRIRRMARRQVSPGARKFSGSCSHFTHAAVTWSLSAFPVSELDPFKALARYSDICVSSVMVRTPSGRSIPCFP